MGGSKSKDNSSKPQIKAPAQLQHFKDLLSNDNLTKSPSRIAALPENNANGGDGGGGEVGMECVFVGRLKEINMEWAKSVAGCEIGERAKELPK
jgi:hypothetical protein